MKRKPRPPHGGSGTPEPPRWRSISLADFADTPSTDDRAGDTNPADTWDESPPDGLPENLPKNPARKPVRKPADPRRKALELLTRREHSQRELIRKLTERGFDADTATSAVEEMRENGWQNDTRFAEMLARNRMQAGYGPVRIRAELRQHGIDSNTLQAALDACEADWDTLAAELLQRRFGTAPATTHKETARRAAYLQRRGFDLDSVRYALGGGIRDSGFGIG